MHLHRLTFQAVGPFPGRHEVDLARLGAGGLFLLEGPTGSGKSTLIDMVVFALYGKVASREASEDRLRSGHAAPDTETFVDLVLETTSGVFRVRRTPAYQRPKQRGTGTTTQQAGVRLWRLADPDAPEDGELLSARLDEAGAELQRIVGLDREQFVQTVVLPQGEFAGFLRAKPEDRRGLLQKVFGTGVYEQVQTRLERMRAEVQREVQESADRVRRAVAAFAGAAGLEQDDVGRLEALADAAFTGAAARDGEETPSVEGLAEEHTARLSEVADAAQAVALAAKERCAATQAAWDDARRTAEALTRRDRLREQRAALRAQEPAVAEARACRDSARRAAPVLPALDAVDRARRSLTATQGRLEASVESAPDDLRHLHAVTPEHTRQALVGVRDECAGLLAVLGRLAEVEAALPGRRARLDADEAAHQTLLVERDAAEQDRRGRPDGRTRLEDSLAGARADAAGLPAAETAVADAEERLAAADDVAALAVRRTRVEEEVARLARAASDAVTHEAAVRAARIAGIAGELASGLVAGEPCPVCGACEHPSPAALTPDHVGPDDVTRAEEARAAAEARVADASARLADVDREVTRRSHAAGGLDQETAKAALLTAQDVVRAARAAVRRRSELEQELVRYDAATVALDQRVTDLTSRVAADRTRLDGLARALADAAAAVAAELDGCSSVAARVAVVRGRTDAVTAWLDALAAREECRAALTEREADAAAALVGAGFADADDARGAALPAVELAALDRRVDEHARAVAAVEGALAAPELAELPEHVTVDVAAAAAAHAEVDTRAVAATQEAARLADRATAATSALRHVRAAVAAAEDVRRRAVPVVRMANLAAASGGDNAKQLTLATYVLARRFEDVVAAANHRLLAMSAGRFELVRSEEKEAVRSRRTGLAMKVVDHHLEAERDARTLSGGETFYVSLCLALGLADVVTAEAGGVDLGTLFIDEGFGTLDPETLDVVLAELGRLRAGGRVVGVVSHVDALKQSIADRVEVRRRPDGTSTLEVRAG